MMNPESEKPEKTQEEINEDIIASLSSSEKYFIVYPWTKSEQNTSKSPNLPSDPIVVVYKDDDKITVGQLMKKYDNYNKKLHPSQHPFSILYQPTRAFILESGYPLEKNQTIGFVKRRLKQDNLDGLVVYAEKIYSECALFNANSIDKCIQDKEIQIPIIIEQIGYYNYLKIKTHEQKGGLQLYLKNQICKKIKLEFDKSIDPSKVQLQIIYDIQVEGDPKENNLTPKDKIKVTVTEGLFKKPTEMRNRLILKGENFKGINLDYDAIKSKKIKDLLKDLDQSKEWNSYGLMIGDIVLKNYQSIESVPEVDDLFKPSTGTSKHIIGLVINEAHIFQKELPKIAQQGQLNFDSIFFSDNKNIEFNQKCESMIKQRAQRAPEPEFKKKENVTPIFRYTSEIKVFGSLEQKQDKPASIYRNLNYFLRKQNIAQQKAEDYKKHWEYLFTSNLLNQLNKLPSVEKCPLWRGVDYQPTQLSPGKRVLYKQFNSSSKKRSTAENFAGIALLEIKQSHSGKLIKDYSYFATEEEVLFPPYCQFEILQVKEIDGKKKKQNYPATKIKHIVMKEIQRDPLPEIVLNYILWVDDKPKEGKEMWNAFHNVQNTTVMKQLLSTQELQQWLINHHQQLSDPDMKVSLITNMTRREGNNWNEVAGVQGILLFRNYLPNSNIFIYIGDRRKAIEKLNNANLQESEILEISCAPSRLKEFLKKNGDIQ